MTHDGNSDGLMELARPSEQRCYAQTPVRSPPTAPNPEQPQRFHKSLEVRPRDAVTRSSRSVVFQEGANSLVIVTRLIELFHEFAVAVDEEFAV